MTFNHQEWHSQMLRLTDGAIRLGTKNTNPLVRYKERDTPYKACPRCQVAFTHLGLTKHIKACRARRRR